MASYSYKARTRSGEKVEGSLDANDKRTALAQLERMGYVPVAVNEQAGQAMTKKGEKKTPGSKPTPLHRAAKSKSGKAGAGKKPVNGKVASPRPALFGARIPRMKMRDVLLFTRELSDLLASGMTLGSALNTLSRRKTKGSQDAILKSLRDDIVQGASLSEALAKHPRTFGNLYISMVKAGEASGTLPDVLVRLAGHYERVQEAQEKVLMALVYPAIIMMVGAGTLIFSMIFVIPRFTAIFEELESELPASTQLLASMSTALMNYWWLYMVVGVALIIVFRRALATHAGRRWWDGFLLRVPLVRQIVCANAFGQFARTLSALLNNGVQVVNALTIVENTVGNTVISDELHAARERVVDGSTISGPLSEGKVFPQLLTDMLAVGEESGDMGGALEHIANRYDRELDRTVKIFTTVLEPIMILVMAGLVGFIAVSMLSAVFDMTSGLNS